MEANFLGPLREGEDFLFREIFMKSLRDILKRPCKRATLSIEALLGNLEGVRLLSLLREKENVYMGSFSWTQRTLKFKCRGHLEL